MGRIGRWDFRQRRKHSYLRQMAMGSMAGLFPVLMMVLIGLWWDVHCSGYFMSEEYKDARFRETAEKVATQVDAYRSEHGHLPDSLCVEGIIKCWWDEISYIDTTKWDWQEFIYQHWGDSAYTLISSNWRARFVSSPKFEGYVFHHWDKEVDSIRVDTVLRTLRNPLPTSQKCAIYKFSNSKILDK